MAAKLMTLPYAAPSLATSSGGHSVASWRVQARRLGFLFHDRSCRRSPVVAMPPRQTRLRQTVGRAQEPAATVQRPVWRPPRHRNFTAKLSLAATPTICSAATAAAPLPASARTCGRWPTGATASSRVGCKPGPATAAAPWRGVAETSCSVPTWQIQFVSARCVHPTGTGSKRTKFRRNTSTDLYVSLRFCDRQLTVIKWYMRINTYKRCDGPHGRRRMPLSCELRPHDVAER